MTKLRKWLVACFMAVITLCVSMGSALLNVTQTIFSKLKASATTTDYAYSNTNTGDTLVQGKVVSIKGLDKTATLYSKTKDNYVKIPQKPDVFELGESLTAIAPLEVVVEIKNPYGDYLVKKSVVNTTQIEEGADDLAGNYLLKPTQIGVYTVQYAVKTKVNDSGDYVWTMSDIYQIDVRAESYSYDILPNDPIVMPQKLDTRNTNDKGESINKTVDVSLPVFYDKNGDQIESFVISSNESYYYVAEYVTLKNVFFEETDGKQNAYPTVLTEGNETRAEGRNIFESFSTYQIKQVPVADFDEEKVPYGVIVEVNVPGEDAKTNALTISSTENLLKINEAAAMFEDDTCFYAKNPFKFEAKAGKNFIQFKLCDYAMTDYAAPYAYTQPHVIEGTNSYKSDDIAVATSTSKVVKSSEVSLKEKQYLPEVSVVDNNENKNAINAYYYYNVKYITKDGPSTAQKYVVMGVDEKGFYFIPQEEGTYNISYNARDFYNNQDSNYAKYDYNITVTDRNPASFYFVDSYDYKTFTKAMAEQAENTSYLVPTKTIIAKNNDNPTEIAIPALAAFDAVDSFEDLTVEITITSTGSFLDGSKDKKQDKYYSLNVLKRSTGATDNTVKVTKTGTEKEDVAVIYYKDVAKGTYEDFYVQDSKFYYSSNDEEIIKAEDLIKAKASQTAYLKLDSRLFGEGKYTIEYSVTDAAKNQNRTGEGTISFELVEEPETALDTVAPTVKFGTVSIGNVSKGEEISIVAPKIEDNTDAKTYNKYYVLVKGEKSDSTAVNEYLEIKPVDGKLTFNTNDKIDGTNSIYDLANSLKERVFKIVAFAFDDFAEIVDPTTIDIDAIDTYKNVGFGSYTVTLMSQEDDTTPIISSRTDYITTENNKYDQFSTVSVNGIKFYDDTSTARVVAQVFDSEGNTYPVEEIRFDNEEDFDKNYYVKRLDTPKTIGDKKYYYEYNYPGIKFPANKADNYTINYTVVDNGGNSASYSFVLRTATDKEAPVIEGVLGTYETKELGETFYLNTLTSTDKSDVTYSFNVVGENVGNKTSWFNTETKQFTPYAADTYTITVRATDKEGNYSTRTFVIKFVDSKNPVLEIVKGTTSVISVKEKQDDGSNGVDWKNNKFPTIDLPTFTVRDANSDKPGFANILTATGSLTITTPSNDSYTIDINGVIDGNNPLNIKRVGSGDDYKFTFTPTARGHYIAKYTGEDKAGNKVAESKQIDIYIGDTEQPIITLGDNLANTLKSGFTVGQNQTLVIDPKVLLTEAQDENGDPVYKIGSSSDLSVSDNFGFNGNTENEKVYTRVSVQVVDSNNSIVNPQEDNDNNGLYCYTFDKAGTYTITFTVSDGVGMTGKLSTTFKVSATETGTTDAAKILGTVLIIVSIVILAGVVVYFVKGTKMLPKRNKAKKQQKQEDKKDN